MLSRSSSQWGGCNAQIENSITPTRAKPSKTFSTARVASVRLLSFSEPARPTRTHRARSPARPGNRKFAMFPIPRTVRQFPMLGRGEEGKINCQRHARNGKFKKNTASGTRRNGPFSRPSALQDCLRSTRRRRRARHPTPMRTPTTADWTRNLRPKASPHLLCLQLGFASGPCFGGFFQEIDWALSRCFQCPPQILTQHAEHHHLHASKNEQDHHQRSPALHWRGVSQSQNNQQQRIRKP